MDAILQPILDKFEEDNDCTIIYVTVSGSRLYGTHTAASDTDYMGIFMPSPQSLLTKRDISHWTHTTGDDSSKNGQDDIDITLWSIHKFLSGLQAGETGAVDLLFSMASPSVLFDTPQSKLVQPYALANLLTKNASAFIGYAIGQSQKYGIKGARYKELQTFTEWLDHSVTRGTVHASMRLSDCLGVLDFHISRHQYKHISITRAPGPKGSGNQHELIDYVAILDKIHASDITAETLLARCKEKLSYAGNRTKAAAEGTDWKSLSNALRVVMEISELLTTGSIVFPLGTATTIRSIKQGKIPLEQVTLMSQSHIDRVDRLILSSTLPESIPNTALDALLLQLYKD